MSKILLLGKDGQVGWELQRALPEFGELLALGRADLDVTDLDALATTVRSASPDVILNATAYTDVDGAEEHPEIAQRVNADAPGALARTAAEVGAHLIHFSTDYVFDGQKRSPYTEEDAPLPLNVYGQTKLAGERAVQEAGPSYWIFRTSWVYSTRRECFVTKVLRWSRSKPSLRIVNDQSGSPTWCRTLAQATCHALREAGEANSNWLRDHRGVFHVAAAGAPSRYQFARAVLKLDPKADEQIIDGLIPATSDEFPTPALRPAYSALDCSKFKTTFHYRLPRWQEALEDALAGP